MEFEDVLQVFSDAEQTYLAIDEIREEIRGWGDVVSRNENTVTLSCDNSGTLSVSLNQQAPTDVTWQFQNCQLSVPSLNTIILDGTYTYRNTESETGGTQNIEGFQEIDLEGRIVATSEPIAMHGSDSWDIELKSGGVGREIYTTNVLEFLRGTDYQAITNAQTELNTANGITTVELNARLIGSLTNGYVDIVTLETIQRPSGGGCPSIGTVRVGEPEISGVEILYDESMDMDLVVGPDTVATATVIGSTESKEYDSETCGELIF